MRIPLRVTMKLALSVVLLTAINLHEGKADTLTPISEETSPAACDPGSFITSIRCAGRYCDDITVICSPMQGTVLGKGKWNAWVSEEGSASDCPPNYFIAGLACKGSYCDNISTYCVELRNAGPARNCWQTAEVSEEGSGEVSFFTDVAGQRVFARSVKCFGRYCDRMSFSVCEVSLR
jgi:hypothetical protein